MAVADAASIRTVAVQLRALSADEDNQPIIAREDGCLRALISFVNGDDLEIAAIAVSALKNLSSHPDNFGLLRSETELLEGLKDLLLMDSCGVDLRRDIFDVLEELTDEQNDDEMDELDELEQRAGLDANEANKDDNCGSLLAAPATTRLNIPNISDDIFCTRVEQLIIRKQGVISVVFEIGAEIAVIYSRLPSTELASFVTTMTGAAVDILSDEEKSEEEDEDEGVQGQSIEMRSDRKIGQDGNRTITTESGYLDKAGERFQDIARKNAKKKNTVSHGATSLAERLEAQRQEESRKKARGNRLLNSIGRGFNQGFGFW